MLPLCAAEGVAVLPWSPLARGRLARPAGSETARSRGDAYAHLLYDATEASDRAVVERVEAVAAARGVPMAQVALAWLLSRAGVTAPIIGATRPDQLDDAAAGLTVRLEADEVAALEQDYVPHAVVGFS